MSLPKLVSAEQYFDDDGSRIVVALYRPLDFAYRPLEGLGRCKIFNFGKDYDAAIAKISELQSIESNRYSSQLVEQQKSEELILAYRSKNS